MAQYRVEIVSIKEKTRLMSNFYQPGIYETKAAIHGTCVKLFTDSRETKERWENNFEQMPDWIRPHARLFSVSDRSNRLRVQYEPLTRTAIVRNCGYYGWLKSIALAVVADFLEDVPSEHRRYSVHGSFVDMDGKGMAIIGPPKSGKTTLTYGLLLDRKNNFLADDWFFIRLTGKDILVFSSEKNSYVGADLAQNWPQLADKLKDLRYDSASRGIADAKMLFGNRRVRTRSTLACIVLLTRKPGKQLVQKLSAGEAVRFMIKTGYCNPHVLVRTKMKNAQRKAFFTELFSRMPVYLLNTIETPARSLERLKKLCEQINKT